MKMTFLGFLLILICLCVNVWSQTGNDTKTLIKQLFVTDEYDIRVRPVKNQSVVDVSADFYLNSIIEFDEQNEMLRTAGYLELYWIDEYLKWDPDLYNNVTYLFIPQEQVWKPDISLTNTYSTFKGLGSSYLNVLVENDGWVRWTPFQVLDSTCSVNIKYYPFDSQTCSLKFSAWSYTKYDVQINLGKKGVMLPTYSPNAAWDLVNTSYTEVNNEEAAVIFTLTLKRKPTFFLINIVSPVILLTVLNIFTFVLPAASGERAGFSITVFLSLAVFLTIMSSVLPNNSDTVSLLAIYLTLMVILSTTIVVACLFELRLFFRNDETHAVGSFYRALHSFSQFLQGKTCTPKNVAPQPTIVTPIKQTAESEDISITKETVKWVDVVNSLDFLFFWLAFMYTVFCTVIILSVSVANK